jgi:hypothetical protein
LTITYLPVGEPQNQPPAVAAGPDQTINVTQTAALYGTVSDDGLPNPPGALATTWSVVSGPGSASFVNPNAVDTTASFSAAGVYVLRLSADDGALTAFDELTITVNAAGSQPITLAFQDGVSPTTAYRGTRDARLESGSPTTSGGALSLQGDGTPDTSSLLQWDITAIPSGSVVQSASITLNTTNTSVDSYEFYQVLRPWLEAEVTWNESAAGSPWQIAGAMGAADASTTVLGAMTATAAGQATVQLNAAGVQAVQAWVNNPTSNFGLLLADYTAATDLVVFTSREGNVAANRPRLTVTYVAPSAPLTAKAADAAIASWSRPGGPSSGNRTVASLASSLNASTSIAQRIQATDELARRSRLPAPREQPLSPSRTAPQEESRGQVVQSPTLSARQRSTSPQVVPLLGERLEGLAFPE